MVRNTIYMVAALSLVVSGCQQAQQGTEAEDSTNPYFRRALQYEEDQNYYAAIQEYEKALAANPAVAKAHVEMGVLYNEKLGDPISAIYHYQKYLNARPNAPDRDKIQSYLDKAKIDFAITLPNSPAQNAEEIARINRENVDLKQALAEAQAALSRREDDLARLRVQTGTAAPAASSDGTSSVPVFGLRTDGDGTGTDGTGVTLAPAGDSPAPAATAVDSAPARSHTIQSGDSLWKIASQFYPDDVAGGVKKIQEANPQKAGNPQNLKLGDVLVIP